MATAHSRFRPFQILDADWRRKIWKRWLRSQFTEGDAKTPPAAPVASTTVPPPPEATTMVQRETETRRGDIRVRFDALFDRLLALEDAFDAFSKRFALKGLHERRQQQRLLERIDNAVDVLERQSLSLESVSATMQRVEMRVDRIEHWLRLGDVSPTRGRTSESRRAPVRGDFRRS